MHTIILAIFFSFSVFAHVPDGGPTPIPKVPIQQAISIAQSKLTSDTKPGQDQMILISLQYMSSMSIALDYPTEWPKIKQFFKPNEWGWIATFAGAKNRFHTVSYVINESQQAFPY